MQLQDIFVKFVLFPGILFSEIFICKVRIKSKRWDHLGHNPVRRTYYLHLLPQGAKFWTGRTSGPKYTVMLSIMCCSALHITVTGGLLAESGVLVQQFKGFRSLLPSFSPFLEYYMSLIIHLLQDSV